MSQNPAFDKLVRLLKELFQLDQPDLDFGLYRIMHARADEISQFLDRDLLPQVKEAFSQYKTADKAELEKELKELVAGIEKARMNPDDSPEVKELRQKIAEQGVDVAGLEQEVYDHLYKFFRRYYHEGDFLAKRVYKPGVYAIPYEGEEVKLHWANKDQYYIKTSEYLRDYAFTLKPGADDPMRVHFRLADAAEGEHGNVKETEGNNRVFILAGEDFIAEEDGESGKELVIRFEYRPATMDDWSEQAKADATAAAKKKPPTQKDLRADAVRRILAVDNESLKPWLAELAKTHIKADGESADYSRLAAHLNRYTARNTFDYFIHKDLGGFLRRELDFYIKNEVMFLDDIESETAPRVEQYLSKIKVIRQIAGKIIEFLAQLENFQKKLWLKKKFVTETSWCIRVSCIPEEFYSEIAANEALREEWVRLHAIDEIERDLTTVAYSEPLTPNFLKSHPTLMVDTRHFDEGFTQRLLEAMGDIDGQTDGVLFHGENLHALSLMRARFRHGVKSAYIDPPYNTGDDGFPYKDSYPHSSWMTMIENRVSASLDLLGSASMHFCSIDRDEHQNLLPALFEVFGEEGFVEELVWQKAYGGGGKTKWINNLHEYIPCFTTDPEGLPYLQLPPDEGVLKYYKFVDDKVETRGHYRLQPLYSNSNDYRENLTYPLPCPRVDAFESEDEWREQSRKIRALLDEGALRLERQGGEWCYLIEREGCATEWDGGVIYPEKQWQWSWDRTRQALIDDEIVIERRGQGWSINYKQYLIGADGSERGKKPSSILIGPYTQSGTQEVRELFGYEAMKFPKPTELVRQLVGIDTDKPGTWVLDYFSGSGSTGHAVVNLNREDGGKRKCILVEIGDYFDSVLLPRLKKVTFTPEWKAGKPKRLATQEETGRSPRIMKVLRLESYEDALNNLKPRRTETQGALLESAEAQGADGLREQYLLRYMLDVETRGSHSLLNIDAFSDPSAYRLKVKRPGSEETRETSVDLLETFNWLIGLTVETMAAPQTVNAAFKRDDDPDLPEENPRRLLLDGRLRESADSPWWFRTVTGTNPDGCKTLVIWRKLTGEPEQDNLVLDAWFQKQGYSSKDSEFDLIYVNGDNNLENLRQPDDTWKVRLIEEDFHRLMFEEAEA